MDVKRPDLANDLAGLRASRAVHRRAVADNFVFEENVGPQRQMEFEAFSGDEPGLTGHAADYFREQVQGATRTHIPTTFRPANDRALLSADLEPNQRIARLECIDHALLAAGLDFAAVAEAAPRRDATVLDPLLRVMNGYPGARPAFACFRAEVADDLPQNDWLTRLIARLGLGHYHPAPGQIMHFMLMEYLAKDVIDTRPAAVARAFAVPTVLECQSSPFFFPAPFGCGHGFTVDLDHAATRPTVREFLHTRIRYSVRHGARVGTLTGPAPAVKLAIARDAHLGRLRAASKRADYGGLITGMVDDGT